jgi:hypothetical protein
MLPLLHSALLAEGCIEHYQWSARTVNVGQAASRVVARLEQEA